MSVSITFEPSGISGLVAEGTYLIDAARRMGVSLGAGCTAGKGECPECVVSVKSGVNLISQASLAEKKQLEDEQLSQGLRLACQVKLEHHGEIVVMGATAKPKPTAAPGETEEELRRKFGELPLSKKIATLLQFEVITVSQAFDAAIDKPLAFGAKAFDSISNRARGTRTPAAEKK